MSRRSSLGIKTSSTFSPPAQDGWLCLADAFSREGSASDLAQQSPQGFGHSPTICLPAVGAVAQRDRRPSGCLHVLLERSLALHLHFPLRMAEGGVMISILSGSWAIAASALPRTHFSIHQYVRSRFGLS